MKKMKMEKLNSRQSKVTKQPYLKKKGGAFSFQRAFDWIKISGQDESSMFLTDLTINFVKVLKYISIETA